MRSVGSAFLFVHMMFTLTKIFPQIGWAVPQCLWPISHLWPPMMSFKHEEDFLRCKWARAKKATDIMSSMQCSPFLSAWPTSAPEIAALRSLLPILFCYFIAPATALKPGGGKDESVAQERGVRSSHELSLYCFCFLATQLNFWEHRAVLCDNRHYDGQTPCINNFLIIMA